MFKIISQDGMDRIGSKDNYRLSLADYGDRRTCLLFNGFRVCESSDDFRLYRLLCLIDEKHDDYLKHDTKFETVDIRKAWCEVLDES